MWRYERRWDQGPQFTESYLVKPPARQRCKLLSYAVAHETAHIGAALACSLHLDRHRHSFASCSLLIPASPASVDAISHPMQPHSSGFRIPYDTVFGPRACIHSSLFPSRAVSLSIFSLFPCSPFTHRLVLCSSFARSACMFTFCFDIPGSPFS